MKEFDILYRKYSADVFRFAFYLSGHREEAEDITSETFVRAWSAPGRIRTATVKGYLFTIARNLFLQDCRKKARRVELDETLLDVRAGPDIQAENRAELQSVIHRLQRLPEADRAALLMRTMESMPHEEIARVLNISLSAAKVKVHRARLALMESRDPSGESKLSGE